MTDNFTYEPYYVYSVKQQSKPDVSSPALGDIEMINAGTKSSSYDYNYAASNDYYADSEQFTASDGSG